MCCIRDTEHPTIEPHFCGLDVPGQRCWEIPRLTTIQKYRPDEAFEESDFQRYWKFAVFEDRRHLVETCFSHSYTPSDLFLAPSIWCQHRSQVVERVNLFYPSSIAYKVARWRLPFLRDHHAKGLLAADLQSFVRRSIQNEVQEPLKAFFWISNECRVICVPDVVDTDTVDDDSVVRFLEPSEYVFAVQVEEVRTHHAPLTYPTIDFSPLCQAVWKLDGTLLEVIEIVDDPLVFLIQSDVLEHLVEAFVANSIKGFLVIDKADVDVLLVLYVSFAKHPQSENGISRSFGMKPYWHWAISYSR